MGILETWGSFFGRFVKNTAELSPFPFTEQYLRAWCNVTQKYPNAINQSAYGRSYTNAVCGELGFPPPQPFRDFEGGNCAIRYEVKGYYIEANSIRGCGKKMA